MTVPAPRGQVTGRTARRLSWSSNERHCMIQKVSTIDLRWRLGDLINRAALRHDEFIIARRGKPLARRQTCPNRG
jgi:hypothetical protein